MAYFLKTHITDYFLQQKLTRMRSIFNVYNDTLRYRYGHHYLLYQDSPLNPCPDLSTLKRPW